ncbi:MAG: hypothetical protein U1C97_00435, partial [Candidatus Gracilibacteria bacterium]|nr:hypothetical protein [Candidatus Gracilibacteria bacterium]
MVGVIAITLVLITGLLFPAFLPSSSIVLLLLAAHRLQATSAVVARSASTLQGNIPSVRSLQSLLPVRLRS